MTHFSLFGMNIVSLAGLALMGVTLTLSRQKQVGSGVAIALMSAGTVLLALGFYLSGAFSR
jgi:hypothetical protein